MLVVPTRAVPSQTLTTNLNNQPCVIDISQKRFGMFLDLYVNDVLIIGGVLCENLNRIVRDDYLGFSGDLFFLDNQAPINLTTGLPEGTDPVYTGLGSRYSLMYMLPGELVAGQ